MKNFGKIISLLLALMLLFVSVAYSAPEDEGTVSDEAAIEETVDEADAVVEDGAESEDAAPVEGENPEADADATATESDEYMYDLEINVKSNGTFSLTLVQPMVGEYLENIDSYVDAYKSSFENEGYSVEKNEAGDTIIIKKDFEDTPSILLPGDSIAAHQFAVKKGLFYDTYFLTERGYDMSSYPEGQNYFKIKLTTPFKPVYSNAISTQGKTSIFGIKTGFSNPVDVIFRIYKPIPIACLVMVILLLVAFLIIVTNKKKNAVDFSEFDIEDVAEEIKDGAENIYEDVSEKVEEAEEKANEIFENAKNMVEEIKEDVFENTEAEATEEAPADDETKDEQ